MKIGGVLTAGSLAAMIIFWITTVILSLTQGHPQVVGSGSTGNGGEWLLIKTDGDFHWHYLIPIVLCGVTGLLCLLCPPRKPPILHK
jgi:hypothetical protein